MLPENFLWVVPLLPISWKAAGTPMAAARPSAT